MPRMEIPFCGPAYKAESYFMNAEECINFYLRPYPDGGRNKLALMGCPGLEAWVDLGTAAPIRGSLAFGNYLYVVSANHFFRVSAGGAAVEKGAGTIVSTSGLVSMATNGLDITFVDGTTKGYVYNIGTDTLSVITDPDFPGGGTIAYIDGYYFINAPNTHQMHQSTFNDGTDWPGYYSSAGSIPDNIVALFADHDELWAFGEQSTEVWYNANNSGFILSCRPGGFFEQGCAAASSPAKINNAIYWLGKDLTGQGHVIQVAGGVSGIVSTRPIEYQISQYSTISDAIGIAFELLGFFYMLTFPTGDVSWVYDTENGLWHQRSSWITAALG